MWVGLGGDLWGGGGVTEGQFVGLGGGKNPNVNTLTLEAVKYLISALVGFLLKLALFLKTVLKICMSLSSAEYIKLPSCHPSLPLNDFKQFAKVIHLFKSRTAWNEQRKIQFANIRM